MPCPTRETRIYWAEFKYRLPEVIKLNEGYVIKKAPPCTSSGRMGEGEVEGNLGNEATNLFLC